MMKSFFADIHCHPTLRPYNMLKENVWYKKEPIIGTIVPFANYSQASMIQLAESNVKIVFASLCPVEQGFFKWKGRWKRERMYLFIHTFLHFPISRVNSVQNHNHDYFDDLIKEYDWLRNYENKPNGNHSFKIATCYDDIRNQYSIDDNFNVNNADASVVMLVLTIEGAHSFGCGQENTSSIDPNDQDSSDTQNLLEKLKKNINIVKNLNDGKHCPLFITFSHHFWNQLCGQSISFPKLANIVLEQDHPDNPDYNAPLTYLGVEMLKELLKPNRNGRRILIDTKHMSVFARKWYYNYASENNIPVLSSHSAVNAYADIDSSHEMNGTHEDADKKYKESKTFNDWDINLSKEEIKLIVKTGGLIGINFDKRILTGQKLLDKIKFKIFLSRKEKRKREWAGPLANNIIEIAQTLAEIYGNDDNRIWEHIAIGSDFDGVINPLPTYNTVEEFPALVSVLCELLCEKRDMNILKNKTDQQIDEIIEGFKYKNVLRFLSRNYK